MTADVSNTRKLRTPKTGDDPEAEAQADFEGVRVTDKIEFYGETFALATKVGYMPLLKFAHYAAQGGDTSDMQAMASMYALLRGCFDRGQPCGECDICTGTAERDPDPRNCETRTGDEWERFERYAELVNADDDDLFSVIQGVIEAVTSRPTRQRSGSQQQQQSTSARSRERSPDQASGLMPVSDLAR